MLFLRLGNFCVLVQKNNRNDHIYIQLFFLIFFLILKKNTTFEATYDLKRLDLELQKKTDFIAHRSTQQNMP